MSTTLPEKPTSRKYTRIFIQINTYLDNLYRVCGGLAGGCLVALLLVIVGQMAARWAGIAFPGSTAYAGYLMAGAAFFALSYAFAHNSHIRVNLLLNKLGKDRKFGEIWGLIIGSGLGGYFAYFAIKSTYFSYQLGDISQRPDAMPIWIPQLTMAFGTTVFAIALIHKLAWALINFANNFGNNSPPNSTHNSSPDSAPNST